MKLLDIEMPANIDMGKKHCTVQKLQKAGAQTIIKVSGHQYRWLAACYDLEKEHF